MTTNQKIRVWETEDAVLVIWGTHDPNASYGAAVDWYEANSEVPDGLAAEIFNAAVTGSGEYWGDPALLDNDETEWPVDKISSNPVKGWTPYVAVSW